MIEAELIQLRESSISASLKILKQVQNEKKCEVKNMR